MLKIDSSNSTVRTFQDRMADNYTSIPLLSREWTNFNPSDPGITILENLTAFEALQATKINAVNDRAFLMLLSIAGFRPRKGKCARLLLAMENAGSGFTIRNNQRFLLGDLIFETRREINYGGEKLTGVFSYYDDKFHDHSYLSDRDFNVQVKVFGDKPKEGDSIYFLSNSLPSPNEDTWFYITLDSRFNRNPVEDRADNLFAQVKWECYTTEGFKEMKVRDYTGAFLSSGEIRLRMPEEKAEVYDGCPEKGYCIRATLTRANYDIRPVFTSVDAFMFEVWQKDTRALSMTFNRAGLLRIHSPFPDEGYILVFGKESKGSSYRRYELTLTGSEKGRYCLYKKEIGGYFTLEFDGSRFGFEPGRFKDAVKVVIYSEEMMRIYRVGTVYGYDDQEIDLGVKHLVTETFSLIAKRTDSEGNEIFDFVRPGKEGDGILNYTLSEKEGKIVIEDAGDFIGAELFLAGVSISEGPLGNVRAGNRFYSPDAGRGITFYNPGPGVGGAFSEDKEDVQKRFRDDLFTPYTCVTAADYERAVYNTPGLCIRKVRARMDEMENLIHISVMPGTDEERPKLSETYRKAISEALSDRRLITTRFQILSPVYVGVSIRATVYIKRHFADCRERIEERIRENVDYVEGNRNFGEVLKFEEVFRAVEELDCVEFIYEMTLLPENIKRARVIDTDIHPVENCLLYTKDIELETVTYGK